MLILFMAWSGCAPGVGGEPQHAGRGRRPEGRTASGPLVFAPTSPPATRYSEPIVPPPPSPLGDAVVAAARDAAARANARAPVADARLFRACAELAQVVPEDGVVPYAIIEFALQRNGIIEPSPLLLVVWGDIGALQSAVEQLRPRIGEPIIAGHAVRIGAGAARRGPGNQGAMVVALLSSGVTMSPMPRATGAGGSFALDATVDARYRDPTVEVTRPDGSVERIALQPGSSGGFTAQIACSAAAGQQQVGIVANDAQGSKVLANFPVWCGVEPPRSLTIAPSRDDLPVASAAEIERRLVELANRDRHAAGLPALVWDESVASLARAHSDEMRRTQIVAHVLPTTGGIVDHVLDAQHNVIVRANVALAYSVGDAHRGLMNTPGARASILSRAATHVALGAVLGENHSGRQEMYITEVFTYARPTLDPGKAIEQVRERVAAVRPVGNNPELDAIAQEFADGLAHGKSNDDAYAAIKHRVAALGKQYARIVRVITTAIELDTVKGAAILGDSTPDDVGIGVVQGPHPKLGDNAIFVVALLATRR